jgi:uncharacterized membrane protein YgdD (TMEM256/DUF423 family)
MVGNLCGPKSKGSVLFDFARCTSYAELDRIFCRQIQSGTRPMIRSFGIAAASLGAAAVALGAFGAHALRGHIDDAALQVWHTAVEYQFWHGLALLAVAGFAPAHGARWWRASGIAFIAGIVMLCGSLYALALGAPHMVGAVTPLGGIALILAWIMLGIAFRRDFPRV